MGPTGRKRHEGDVYVDYKPDSNGKKFRKDDGEYVRFEEVDDDN